MNIVSGFYDRNNVSVVVGDLVQYLDGRCGKLLWAAHDGDADVAFDDGKTETVRWWNLLKLREAQDA